MRIALASFSTLLLSSALLCSLSSAHGQVLTAVNQGNYSQGYYHQTGDLSYLTGVYYGNSHRSYFIFDLTSVVGPITSATFSAYNSSFLPGGVYDSSSTVTDTFTLYTESDPVSAIEAGYPTQTYGEGSTIYNDLVSGTAVGSVTVSNANNGANVNVLFNNAGLSYLIAHEGQQVALGGGLSGANGLFANGTALAQLTLTPEPGSFALLASAVVTAAGFLKSRRWRTK